MSETEKQTIPSAAALQEPFLPAKFVHKKGADSRNASVDAADLETIFDGLASKWYRETRMLSFTRQKALHPCYQKIIGMGKDALPFIFKELSKGKGDWIWALESITRLEHHLVPPGATFGDSVSIWLQWGKDNGYF